MVLSAGFGTRLAPLTTEIPKPLVPLANRALLLRTLESLHELGAENLVVNAHYHSEKIINYCKRLPFKVDVLYEIDIRGTAGGIFGAKSLLLGLPAIVVNGDIVGALPVAELLREPVKGLRLALCPTELGKGTVGVGDHGQVVRLRGERFGHEVRTGDYMGVAQLGDECLAGLPEVGCLIGDWALPHLRKGGEIQTLFHEGQFEDIGSPQAYWLAHMNWLARRGERSLVDSSAIVGSNVRLRSSVVGPDCVIEGEGVLDECVVLEGARVRAPLSRTLVTPAGAHMVIAPELGTQGN